MKDIDAQTAAVERLRKVSALGYVSDPDALKRFKENGTSPTRKNSQTIGGGSGHQ